ncbi:MAG: GAF domain-containing protein [Anaerolineales bacterium]|nr:GAF domain-containing protein [Anaerolineales bacterium]
MLPDHRIRQRDYLLEITRSLTQELNLDILLQRILELAAEMLAGKAGLIALREEEGGWNIGASYGIQPTFLQYLKPILAEIPEKEDQAGQELPQVNRMLQLLTKRASMNLLTGVGLPLISEKRVIGLIFIFRGYEGSFSKNDRAILQSFADQAAIAVINAQLYTQVSRDKSRLDALLDSAADGIIIMSANHKIEKCNQAFARILRKDVSEIEDFPHDEIFNWESLQQGTSLEEAELSGWPLTAKANLYVEGNLKRPSGEIIPVGVTYAPLLSGEGKLINIIASIRDITHFREAEEIKSVFISIVSHELKTPVALIKGYVGTLRRKDVSWDSEIVQDSLEVIEDEADRLTELIENLLDASRLQAGEFSLNLAEIKIDKLAQEMAERFQTQTNRHKIVVQFPDEFPVIVGDENRLEQVFYNLLSNAVKYSPEGGEISISGQIRSKQIIICIQDQGTGISQEDVPHIFDRFFRATEAAKNTQGAGLGLYLSRAIIEAHNGRIWIEPRQETGTRICFSISRD